MEMIMDLKIDKITFQMGVYIVHMHTSFIQVNSVDQKGVMVRCWRSAWLKSKNVLKSFLEIFIAI